MLNQGACHHRAHPVPPIRHSSTRSKQHGCTFWRHQSMRSRPMPTVEPNHRKFKPFHCGTAVQTSSHNLILSKSFYNDCWLSWVAFLLMPSFKAVTSGDGPNMIQQMPCREAFFGGNIVGLSKQVPRMGFGLDHFLGSFLPQTFE